jgi:hypothetical protein
VARQECGIRRADAFSWSKYAREIAALYDRVANGTTAAC